MDDEQPSAVLPHEVYGMTAAAFDHVYPGGWQWANLTAGERDEWLKKAAPIVRAVLEIQRSQPDGNAHDEAPWRCQHDRVDGRCVYACPDAFDPQVKS